MRDPSSYTPLASSYWRPGGPKSLTLSHDVDFSSKQIARFSTQDAKAYVDYEQMLSRIVTQFQCFVRGDNYMDAFQVSAIDPLIESKPFNLSSSGPLIEKLKDFRMLASSLQKIKKDFASFYDLMTAPASKILDQFFDSEPLKVQCYLVLEFSKT